MHFRVSIEGIFWVAKVSNIFGVLEIPDIYLFFFFGGGGGVNGRCWARAYV